MHFPAEIEDNYEAFAAYAHRLFPQADNLTLEALYPMVMSLRGLAARTSINLRDFDTDTLSETATGESAEGDS
jgi:hypothetical protein